MFLKYNVFTEDLVKIEGECLIEIDSKESLEGLENTCVVAKVNYDNNWENYLVMVEKKNGVSKKYF